MKFLVVAALLVLPFHASAQNAETTELIGKLLGARTAPLGRVACVAPTVVTEGTAPQLGLEDETLAAGIAQILVAAIPEATRCEEPVDTNPEVLEKAGFVLSRVWTVGDSYPIALYVRMEGGVAEQAQIFVDESLGFADKKDLQKVVIETLAAMAKKFAGEVNAARGS